jgi:hypothetical protein
MPIAIAAVAFFGYSADARCQVRADPGVVIGGRVAVRVYVTLSDDETPYAPVSGLQLRFFRSVADSVVARTDDAGTATVLLAPGDYRLVSSVPTVWKGARYSWSIPITVRAGMSTIDLKTSTADRRAVVAFAAPAPLSTGVADAAHTALPQQPNQQPPQQTQSYAPLRAPKDGTTATLFSFLLTGGGQFYAGEPGRGVGYLLLGVGGAAVAYAGAYRTGNCSDGYYSYECYEPDDTLIGVGIGTAAFAWIISMVDASAAARRYNTKWGLTRQVAVRPVIAPARNGRAALGLSVALGH